MENKQTTTLGRNIPQEWHDNNREKFEAETTVVEVPSKPCKHYFVRKTATQIGCKNCTNGWIDMGKWKVEKGAIRT